MFKERAHVRKEVSLEGRLIFRDIEKLLTILPCKILDLSEAGAKVQISTPYSLPDKLFLLEDESENLYQCDKRWQNEQTAGLMFIDLCARSKRKALLAEMETAVVHGGPGAGNGPVSSQALAQCGFCLSGLAERLKSGRSLVPDLPLDQAEAERAVTIFNELQLRDTQDCCTTDPGNRQAWVSVWRAFTRMKYSERKPGRYRPKVDETGVCSA